MRASLQPACMRADDKGNMSDDSEEAERLRCELGKPEARASPSGTGSESGARGAAADGGADSGGEREGACIICQESFPETTRGLMVFTCKRQQCAASSLYCHDCYKQQLTKWNRGARLQCPTCRQDSSIKVVGEWTPSPPASHFRPAAKEHFANLQTSAELASAARTEREANLVKTDGVAGKEIMEDYERLRSELDAQRTNDETENFRAAQRLADEWGSSAAGGAFAAGEGGGGSKGDADAAASPPLGSLEDSERLAQIAILEQIKAEKKCKAKEEEATRLAIEKILQEEQGGARGGAAGGGAGEAAHSMSDLGREEDGVTFEELVERQKAIEEAVLKRKAQEEEDAEFARSLEDRPRKHPKKKRGI